MRFSNSHPQIALEFSDFGLVAAGYFADRAAAMEAGRHMANLARLILDQPLVGRTVRKLTGRILHASDVAGETIGTGYGSHTALRDSRDARSIARVKAINILGIRGIPGAHGGFETFAERLALYLRDRGWMVNVYCQLEPDADGRLAENYEDDWEGIHRIHFGNRRKSSAGSVIFDWRCVRDVLKRPGIDLVLGYNTAVLTVLQRLYGRKVFMNMDGIEWQRAKWSRPIKAWFYLNEFIGANICTVPIADHPEIAQHLRRHGSKRAVVIPYGADQVDNASESLVRAIGLEPDKYLISIARIEPENSVLPIVRGFSRKSRGVKLVVLGKLDGDNSYHHAVRAAASEEVVFPGAIYARETLSALRYHALAYVHGHQVGGTNPSLVEALGAGNAVIAHDNRFNRWVAGDEQSYFFDENSLSRAVEAVLARGEELLQARQAARARHRTKFTWDSALADYERIIMGNYAR